MLPETSQKCFKSRFAAGSSAIISITSPLLWFFKALLVFKTGSGHLRPVKSYIWIVPLCPKGHALSYDQNFDTTVFRPRNFFHQSFFLSRILLDQEIFVDQ